MGVLEGKGKRGEREKGGDSGTVSQARKRKCVETG